MQVLRIEVMREFPVECGKHFKFLTVFLEETFGKVFDNKLHSNLRKSKKFLLLAKMATSATNFNTSERRSAVDEACKASEEFFRLYYKTLELRPHRVSQLYLDSAVLIWDGNPYVQSDAIKKFYENLPSLTFNIGQMAMDAQPLPKEAVGGQKTFMITTSGNYRVKDIGSRNFNQTFVITANEDKWKIASDVFRSQINPNP